LAQIDWKAVNSDCYSPSSSLPPVCDNLLDFTVVSKLEQLNHVTNNSDRVLDLVLTNIIACVVTKSSSSLSNVDKYHPPLFLSINFIKTKRLPYKQNNVKFNFKKGDYEVVRAFLKQVDWKALWYKQNNIDALVSSFYTVLDNVIHKYIPLTRPKNDCYPPWFSQNLIKALKEKNKIRLRYKKYQNLLDSIELDIVSRRCHRLATLCYNRYFETLEDGLAENPKLFWTLVKSRRGGTSRYPACMSDGVTSCSDNVKICDMFARAFSAVYEASGNNAGCFVCSNFLSTLELNSACIHMPILDRKSVLAKLTSLDSCGGAGSDNIPPFLSRPVQKS
jgi:hypothetical protein